MVRYLKIVFALIFTFWGILGAIENLQGYKGGVDYVESVISQSHKEADSRTIWATDNPLIAHLGFGLIWGGKLLGGFLCAIGSVAMWRQRKAEASDFNKAKQYAVAGLAVILIMLIGGFNLVAANMYGMWAGPAAVAFDLSWIFAGEAGLIMIFINMPDA